jgi:hypothetical protein
MPTNRCSLVILALLVCASVNGQTLPPNGAPIEVYDGFESPTLSNLWEDSRFTPGAVEMQSAVVRVGNGAVRITLKSRDTFEAGQKGNADSERDELLEARSLTSRENTPYEFSWSMYLPPDFPIVPVRLVVAQWKQYCGSDSVPCSDDSPVLAVRYIGGVLRLTQDLAHKQTVLYEEKIDLRGRWLDLRFQVRFSPQSTGRIRAWLDNKKVTDFTGITANSVSSATGYATPGHFYFKMGLYRNVMPQTMTIYLDEYRKKQLPADIF